MYTIQTIQNVQKCTSVHKNTRQNYYRSNNQSFNQFFYAMIKKQSQNKHETRR